MRPGGNPVLRVTILDRLAIITSATDGAAVAPVAPTVSSRGASVGLAGQGRLNLEFLASPCTESATVDVGESGQQLNFAVTLPRVTNCDSLAETHALDLQLRHDASAEKISVTSTDSDAQSWGVAVPGSDGRVLPVVVVDRSRRVRGAFAISSWDGPPASGLAAKTSAVAGGADIELVWSRQSCDDVTEIRLDQESSAITIEVELASTIGAPCAGPPTTHGVRLRIAGSVDAKDVSARLVVRP